MTTHNRPLRQRKGERGFTLIELLVVIAVLSILAAIVIFNVTGVKQSGNAAACTTDVKSVQAAVDLYVNDNNGLGSLSTGSMYGAGTNTLPAAGSDVKVLSPAYLHTAPTACGTLTLTANPGAGTGWNVTGTP